MQRFSLFALQGLSQRTEILSKATKQPIGKKPHRNIAITEKPSKKQKDNSIRK